MYRSNIVNLGIQKIGDLISANNSFLYNYLTPLATAEQRFLLMRIVNSITVRWHAFVKASTVATVIDPIPSTPTNMMDNGNIAPILDVSSKQIYQSFVGLKQISPSAKQKLTDKYSNTIIEWEKVYSLPFCTTLESKIREFQYKILVFTNVKLYRFGLADSPSCTFCQEEAESIEHLLFSYKLNSEFWKHVLSWLKDNDIYIDTLKDTDLIFGKFDVRDDFTIINHFLLLGKYYIYQKKIQKRIPTFQGFIARTEHVYDIELCIAREKSKLLKHFQKWEKLINVLQ